MNSAKKAKAERNALFVSRYRQSKCEKCKHRSCKSGPCRLCGGKMKLRRKG